MPFYISGNLDRIDPPALIKFQKNFGIILSEKQFEKQQQQLINDALKERHDFVSMMTSLDPREVKSLIFLISQFGDIILEEVPPEYTYFERVPYVIEWKPGKFMIPLEVLEFLAKEKVFKAQNYFFALLTTMPSKEKKAWVKWLEIDYEGDSDKDLNVEIYSKCRILQKPHKGKTLVHENEFHLSQLWKPGIHKIVDWFYKGLTPFYFTMQEVSREEKDPFYLHALEMIRAGKFILKKEPEKFRQKQDYTLVATVEGMAPQFRNTIYSWELEKKQNRESLFRGLLGDP